MAEMREIMSFGKGMLIQVKIWISRKKISKRMAHMDLLEQPIVWMMQKQVGETEKYGSARKISMALVVG